MMAASLQLVNQAADALNKKRLHQDLELSTLTSKLDNKKRKVSIQEEPLDKYTPPPSSSSSLSSPGSLSRFQEPSSSNSDPLESYTYQDESFYANQGVSPPDSTDLLNSTINENPFCLKKKSKQFKKSKIVSTNEVLESAKNEYNEVIASDLNQNIDYITLCSTLNLLFAQKQKIQNDIVQLNNLKNELKENPLKLTEIINGDPNHKVPTRNQIVKCPTIDFTKYGLTYDEEQNILNNEFSKPELDDKSLFKVTGIFQ